MTEIKDRYGKIFNISGPGNFVGKDKDGAAIYQDPVYGAKYLDTEDGQEKLRQEFELKKKEQISTNSTSDINLSTSGASEIDIYTPGIKVNVNIEKEKKIKDPFEWYIKKRLKY